MRTDRFDSIQNPLPGIPWWITVAMCLAAAWLFQVADADGRVAVEWVAFACGESLATIVGGLLLFRYSKKLSGELIYAPFVLAVALLSILWEPLGRAIRETGRPMEMAIMFAQKNVMLSLAAVSWIAAQRRLAAVCSLFLVLFSVSMNSSRGSVLIVAGYLACGIAWMAFEYWETLRPRFLAAAGSPARRWRFTWIVLLLILATIGILGGSPNGTLRAWRGFLPSSGGQDGRDPFARDGVGDGEMLVAGHENISSFANIEDAPFRSSDEPSLYDVFNDTYEEPVLPISQKQQRTIPLPPSVGEVLEQRLAETKRGAREFSTLREQKRTSQVRQRNLEGSALMYVSGRTPLHLRLETYDIYDGVSWHAETAPESPVSNRLKVTQLADVPWMTLTEQPAHPEIATVPEPHSIKVMNLDTNRIPAPLNLIGFQIAHVQHPHFFEWTQPSILSMQRERLPESITIRLTSRLLDERSLESSRLAIGWGDKTHQAVPNSPRREEIFRLGQEWTRKIPPGWPTVREVVKRLQQDYILDSDARPPADCEFTADYFLFESRRGDDYQFATAASVLLRALGYSTRLVSGFYASPERYESRSNLTPVRTEDVHVWLEVYLGYGVWHTVDPTPGYEVLKPRGGFWSRAWSGCVRMFDLAGRHRGATLGGVMLLLITYRLRFDLLDGLRTCLRRWRTEQNPRDLLIESGEVLESRWRWCGRARPAGATPAEWSWRLRLDALLPKPTLETFLVLWSRAVFAPGACFDEREIDVQTLCARIDRELNLSRLRTHLTDSTPPDFATRLLKTLTASRRPPIVPTDLAISIDSPSEGSTCS